MKKKEFKSESKRMLDLMINSIYTNKEIFLRELISNASDAIDKLNYQALTDSKLGIDRSKFKIFLKPDGKNRTLSIIDNGCGMTEEELDKNLGTIAESGSLIFKSENKDQKDVDIIGQFGVGFYSAFMVSKKIEVYSKGVNSEEAYLWTSEGAEGYTIEKTHMDECGTTIKLYLKDDTEDEKYGDYLTEHKLRSLIKKYSDYIRYPIQMETENTKLKDGSKDEYETIHEIETLNSMIPLWKKNKKDITEEEYNNFYSDKFFDYEKPFKIIHSNAEGMCSYKSLLFIPSHAPYDFYTKEFKKGLQLYTSSVLIMDKCEALLPDYYSFVKGIVDTDDLSLNISRETLQNDRKVELISKSIENKIHKELLEILENSFEDYKTFWKNFGMQIKFGIYNNFGMDKDKIKDLLIFYSANKKDFITLAEYVKNMKKKQETIYYACGETISKIDLLPQVESVKDKNYDILYLTDYVDEFTIQALQTFEEKKFVNVCDGTLDLDSKEEKEEMEKLNEESKDILSLMKEEINDVNEVRFTKKLKNHPVCLTSIGNVSTEMEKVINAMPTDEKVKAETILEINSNHPIADKIKSLYKKDKDELKKYTKILYAQARLIEGLSIDNQPEISNLICDLISEK